MFFATQLVGFGSAGETALGTGAQSFLSLGDPSDTLIRTQGVGDSRRKMTFSAWIRAADMASALLIITAAPDDGSSDAIVIASTAVVVVLNAGADGTVTSTGVTFANNTWYHVVIQIDTANATANDRVKIYVDSVDRTGVPFTPATLNYDTSWGATGVTELVCAESAGVAFFFDELAKVDNQLLSASSFATGGHPIDISGLTFGAEGYWLEFGGTLTTDPGTDSTASTNDFTATGFASPPYSTIIP